MLGVGGVGCRVYGCGGGVYSAGVGVRGSGWRTHAAELVLLLVSAEGAGTRVHGAGYGM